MRPLLLAVAVVALLLQGCKKPIAAFVGKWQLDPMTVKSGDPDAPPDIGRSLGLVILEFKPNNVFTMASKSGDQDGTFQVDGSTVTMRFDKTAPGASNQPLTGRLGEGATKMTVTGGGTKLTMTFKKL